MNFFLALLMIAPPLGGSDRWPSFLGNGHTALPPDSIPVHWTPKSNVAWSSRLPGYGQSSPVVWQQRVFVTSVEGPMKDKFHVVCLELATGREIWRQTIDSSGKVELTDYISRAAPTPVVDANQVVAFFESGDVLALSHNGDTLWQRSLANDYGPIENRHGIAASPTQTDDAVFVLVDHDGPSYLVKLAKSNGQTLWKQDRASRQSWSSPVMLRLDDRQYVVVSSQGTIDGYAADSGQLAWSYDQVGGNNLATPALLGENMLLIGASTGSQGQDAELVAKSNMALKISLSADGKPVVGVKWVASRASCSFASPAVHDGLAYWVNTTGVVHCFDAETGERQYVERLDEPCWATPVGIGNRVYFFGRSGTTTVVESGRAFKKLARNRLWLSPETASAATEERPSGPRQYGVAVVSGNLLIRTGDLLYCVRHDP